MKKFFFILFFLFLVSCESQVNEIAKPSSSIPPKENIKKSGNFYSYFNEKMFKQLKMSEHDFIGIVDWLDNESVLVLQTSNHYSVVQTFNIFSGEINEIYRSTYPIVHLELNKEGDVAIHEATSTFEATIVIIENSGKEKQRWSFRSNEIFFAWNEQKPEMLIVTTFLEDWTYESITINTNKKVIVEVEAPNPFLHWLTSEELGYLYWDFDEPSLSAPLYKFSYEKKEHERVLENIVSFHKSGEELLTLQLNNEEYTEVSISIMDNQSMEIKAQTESPILTMYSTIVVPHVDFSEKDNTYYLILPYESGSLDMYDRGFKLVSLSKDGELHTILNQVENRPFKISPGGNFALFGYQLEQIIDFQTETIVELVHVQ
ncbi:YqgU-like beta propeller domain-containing protein [Bacillus alkalisoli]|uniref:YqgU-like beta propeller domain-containing protein n=1 Tax=Bacillus alkalisoli TaxID=2011008 RepID=UPI000C2311C2|nr:hypothetical protein [Bacillus alkalisoli]